MESTTSICWVPVGQVKPPEQVHWWRALDGSGSLGYSHQGLGKPGWTGLTLLMDVTGASRSEVARYHYVVQTDIPAHAEDDFNAWYEHEHLPGLAEVPGTVRARRFIRADGGPRYWACYDLVTPDTMESKAWLAVRGTPWSSRIRPLFQNTRRTLYVRSFAHDQQNF